MLVKLIACAILSCTLSVWFAPIAFAQNSQTNRSTQSSGTETTVIIGLMFALFGGLLFAAKKQERESSKTSLIAPSIKDPSSNSLSNSSSQPASQSAEEISVLCPDLAEFHSSLNAAWRLRGLDNLDDRLDERQREFVHQTNRFISISLKGLMCEVIDRVNILDKTLLHKKALKQLSTVLAENKFEFLMPPLTKLYLSVVDETVKECQRYRIRKASETGDDWLKELTRMITKDESKRSEIESIAKQEFSEKDQNLFQKIIRNMYHRIPYSYYGIYRAIQIRNKEKDSKTAEEKSYLDDYIFYFDRAAIELEEEYYAEYS
jgi:hypothetical protein